jgi:hypothetical protein
VCLILSTNLSESFLILRRTEQDSIKNARSFPCKVQHRYCCHSLVKLEFSQQILGKRSIPNFTKIRPVGADLFYADGRTDMTKLIVVFRNFANAPKNVISINFSLRWQRKKMCDRKMSAHDPKI